jgi:ribosomal protein S18 acetylase RimI-like enzyme
MCCAVASQFKCAAITPAHASAFLANPANYLIVAEVGASHAGFTLAYRLDRLDRVTPQLFIYELDVAPEYRRQGIGTRLLAFVRDLVAAEHLMEAFVVADESNEPAVGLYRRSGARREAGAAAIFVYSGTGA